MCRICKSLWWYTSSTHSEAKYAAASFGTPYNDPQRARWRIGSLISTSKQIRNDKIEATACELNKKNKKQSFIIYGYYLVSIITNQKNTWFPVRFVVLWFFAADRNDCLHLMRLTLRLALSLALPSSGSAKDIWMVVTSRDLITNPPYMIYIYIY